MSKYECPAVMCTPLNKGSQSCRVIKSVNPMKPRYAPGTHIFAKTARDSLPKERQDGIMAVRAEVERTFSKESRFENDKAQDALIN